MCRCTKPTGEAGTEVGMANPLASGFLIFVRRLRTILLTSAFTIGVFSISGWPIESQRISAAQDQPAPQTPAARARSAVETLINRLRGRNMPEGIVKMNGRIEATEVDVSAKYPGRLATLTVNEGDEVTAGQVVATISSPETEAQLRAAQA